MPTETDIAQICKYWGVSVGCCVLPESTDILVKLSGVKVGSCL